MTSFQAPRNMGWRGNTVWLMVQFSLGRRP